jgi:hypothetical protein
LPHSEIHGSKGARPSPRLIAACHVLHRLSVPRHSPDALKTLEMPPPCQNRTQRPENPGDKHPRKPDTKHGAKHVNSRDGTCSLPLAAQQSRFAVTNRNRNAATILLTMSKIETAARPKGPAHSNRIPLIKRPDQATRSSDPIKRAVNSARSATRRRRKKRGGPRKT